MRNVFSTSDTKVYNKDSIGVPMGPARWEGEPKYEDVVLVYITCGGGMGGASYYHILKNDASGFINGGMVCAPALHDDGKFRDMLINTNYIVSAEPLTLVTMKLHNENKNYEVGDTTVGILLEKGNKLTFKQYNREVDHDGAKFILFGQPKCA